jgi:hypothetical protein
VTTVAFSVAPSASAKGNLGPVDGDAQGNHTAVLGHPDPSHQQRHQVQAGSVLGEQPARAYSVRATNQHETADLEVPDAAPSTSTPTGSSPTR